MGSSYNLRPELLVVKAPKIQATRGRSVPRRLATRPMAFLS
ncbi:unnamed protein product [Ectocarpus sp. CCAP 1310/34]|nr:unnamed protein product [Ectocarpus sp. CCAP 1310/34]